MTPRAKPCWLAMLVLALMLPIAAADLPPLPDGFVDLQEIIPSLRLELRYYSDNNFTGRPVAGYLKPRGIATREAAAALKKVQDELLPFGLGIKVFDAYRPQRAVDSFVKWAENREDTLAKARYYPDVAKRDLFKEGYIADRSSHSRGSTVDLTIVELASGTELDMGSPFDFFGPISWPDSTLVSPSQRANRLLLRTLMVKHGFNPYAQEWWHFTLASEPYPAAYFDFPVE